MNTKVDSYKKTVLVYSLSQRYPKMRRREMKKVHSLSFNSISDAADVADVLLMWLVLNEGQTLVLPRVPTFLVYTVGQCRSEFAWWSLKQVWHQVQYRSAARQGDHWNCTDGRNPAAFLCTRTIPPWLNMWNWQKHQLTTRLYRVHMQDDSDVIR